MKIKHKETGIERSVLFGEWIREYVRKELHKDWKILNLLNVVIVKTLHSGGKASTTLMSKGEANKQKNQFSTSTSILKDVVTMEFYQEYLDGKILKIKNQSLFKRFLSNILAIFNPKEIPKKKAEPISRNEFIGAIAVVIAFIMLILYIIVEWDSIYSFFNN